MQSAQETIPSDPIILNRPDANSTSSKTTVSPGTSILILLSAIAPKIALQIPHLKRNPSTTRLLNQRQ
jgi:hypothetical protein